MIESYLTSGNYRITRSNHVLFSGASSPSLALTGDAPTIPYRLRITLSGDDCSGSVTINGAETLVFAAAGKKLTTTTLAANTLPTITTANITCNILVECIDTSGADITTENLTLIDSRIDLKQSGFYSPTGTWTKTDNVIYSNTSMSLGDVVRSNTTDYVIKKKDAYTDIGGTVEVYQYLA